MKLFRLIAIFIFSNLLFSCGIFAVGENYQKPQTKMPNKWLEVENIEADKIKISLTNSNKNKESEWWKNFNDPLLNKIIKKAIANNYDYIIAQSKVIEARANLTSATSNLFPKTKLMASAQRQNNYVNFFDTNSKNSIINLFVAGFDSSWEVDLFGANKRARESEKALFEASQDSKNYVLISIISEVAKNYAEFRCAQNQLFIKKQINQIYEEIIKLNEDKKRVGILNEIDSSELEIELINNKSEISSLESKVETLRYNLEILLNLNAGSMKKILSKVDEIPLLKKDVIIDAPISLLQNRPDIMQAERELASAVALKGYAFAQVFPQISLTGFLGFNSYKSRGLIKPSSQAFSISSSASMPFLNFGGVIAGYKISKEVEKRAFLNYKNKVNNAVIEVESSLVNFLKEDQKLALSTEELEISQKVSNLQYEKYKSGIISNIDYLYSQIDSLNSEEKYILSAEELTIKTIALYKSLGGGWQIIENEAKPLDK